MYFAFVFEGTHPTKKHPEFYAIKVLADTKEGAMKHVKHSITRSGVEPKDIRFVGSCTVDQAKGHALYETAINKARKLNERISSPEPAPEPIPETPVIKTPVVVPEKPKEPVVAKPQVQLSFSKTGQLW